MKVRLIIASVVMVILVLVTTFPLFLARPSVPPITIRHIKTVKSGDEVAVTLSISNHCGKAFIFYPFKVEAREGTGWKTCWQFQPGFTMSSVDPHSFTNYTCDVTNMPSGSSLRLTIYVQEILTGPKGFLRRVQLHYLGRTPNRIALNPYDKMSKVFGMPIEVATEEFVQPKQK